MISLLALKIGIGEIILIVACALIVLGVTVSAIIRKIKGKSGCGGDCGCCSSCPHCMSSSQRDNAKKN